MLGSSPLGSTSLGDRASEEPHDSSQAQKRKTVGLFSVPSEEPGVAVVLDALGVAIDVRESPTLPPPPPPPGYPRDVAFAIVVGDSATAEHLATFGGSTFGEVSVGFFRGTVVEETLARLRQSFNLVETFDSDTRLESLVGGAVSEFLGDSTAATVAGSSLADRATADDSLGFPPYVEAVGEFLLNAGTQPPLTMSIEGSWGSGKSSFMLQLADYLRKRNALAVDFNAWRHEKAEELWAAFAIQFVRSLKRTPKNWRDRLRRELALANRRFDWSRGSIDLVRVALLLVAIAFATVGVPIFAWIAGAGTVPKLLAGLKGQTHLTGWVSTLFTSTLGVGAIAAWLSAVVPVWRVATKQISNPLAIDLKKYLRAPDYETKVAFLDRFHEDLDRVIGAFVDEGQKVFVFIDDLDRCEVPHAADLMQAINLMLADHGPLVFIIGMDREKVAAGLAVKHEKLLPYLSLETPAKEWTTDGLQGLAFGYNFIEKFIQVPFVIPEPTDVDIERLLAPRRPEAPGTPVAASPLGAPSPGPMPLGTSSSRDAAPQPRAYVTLDLGADDPVVIDIAKMVAPALDRNPRRIKQFVNLFRLRSLIADATGLFRAPESTPRSKRLTLQKLGKFVALELRWPLLLAHLEQEPSLVADLERIAIDGRLIDSAGRELENKSRRVTYWSAQPLLMNLLRSRCVTANGEHDESGIVECGLARIDLLLLLRVAPATKRGNVDATSVTDRLLAKRGDTARISGPAYLKDGVTLVPVTLTLDDHVIYYENPDLQASIELAYVDAVEYDSETGTGLVGTLLRLRAHGHVFEFFMDMATSLRWKAALPARGIDDAKREVRNARGDASSSA
jgi:hypothetical protein